jgi:hypothetical protein
MISLPPLHTSSTSFHRNCSTWCCSLRSEDDTAVTVWATIASLFHDNQLSRAVYIDAEYHARPSFTAT